MLYINPWIRVMMFFFIVDFCWDRTYVFSYKWMNGCNCRRHDCASDTCHPISATTRHRTWCKVFQGCTIVNVWKCSAMRWRRTTGPTSARSSWQRRSISWTCRPSWITTLLLSESTTTASRFWSIWTGTRKVCKRRYFTYLPALYICVHISYVWTCELELYANQCQ